MRTSVNKIQYIPQKQNFGVIACDKCGACNRSTGSAAPHHYGMNNDIITILFIIYYYLFIMIVRNTNNTHVSYSLYYMYDIMLLFTRPGVAK